MSSTAPKCPNVGGQAVIEGVMMRGPSCFAVAVRDAKGRIVVRDRPWRSIGEKLRFLRWPFLRGTVVLGESLANGMNALSYSAQIAAEGEAEKDRSASAVPSSTPGPDAERERPSSSVVLPASSSPRPSAPEPSPEAPGSERTTENEERKTASPPAQQAPSFGWLLVPTLLFALLVFKE